MLKKHLYSVHPPNRIADSVRFRGVELYVTEKIIAQVLAKTDKIDRFEPQTYCRGRITPSLERIQPPSDTILRYVAVGSATKILLKSARNKFLREIIV